MRAIARWRWADGRLSEQRVNGIVLVLCSLTSLHSQRETARASEGEIKTTIANKFSNYYLQRCEPEWFACSNEYKLCRKTDSAVEQRD